MGRRPVVADALGLIVAGRDGKLDVPSASLGLASGPSWRCSLLASATLSMSPRCRCSQ